MLGKKTKKKKKDTFGRMDSRRLFAGCFCGLMNERVQRCKIFCKELRDILSLPSVAAGYVGEREDQAAVRCLEAVFDVWGLTAKRGGNKKASPHEPLGALSTEQSEDRLHPSHSSSSSSSSNMGSMRTSCTRRWTCSWRPFVRSSPAAGRPDICGRHGKVKNRF